MWRIVRNLWKRLPLWGKAGVFLIGGAVICGAGYIAIMFYSNTQSNSGLYIGRWFREPDSHPDLITASRVPCGDAPFILPSDGFIGLLYADPAGPYSVLNRHTGIDIFGDGEPGEVPVYAAYDGYLTRLDNWLATVIIQHDDPLEEGRIIWTYYTHLASRDGETSFVSEAFPPGTHGLWVERGTLLGYQGEYSGTAAYAVGLHVHFSIVKSDENGSFLNEARLNNTLDPTPYLGLPLHIDKVQERPIRCES
jgi:peptidoglycan LD-endopeptidase LytH